MQLWKGSEYSRIRVYKLFAYTSVEEGSEYVLNNALWQGSEYVWSTFHRVLNESLVLNMPGLRISQGCEHARVIQGPEYA